MPHHKFKVVFQNDASIQLQQSIHYYNGKQKGIVIKKKDWFLTFLDSFYTIAKSAYLSHFSYH